MHCLQTSGTVDGALAVDPPVPATAGTAGTGGTGTGATAKH